MCPSARYKVEEIMTLIPMEVTGLLGPVGGGQRDLLGPALTNKTQTSVSRAMTETYMS